jgi:hypothetical protein
MMMVEKPGADPGRYFGCACEVGGGLMPEEIRAPGPAMIQPQRNSGAASRWEAPHKLRAALAVAAKTLSWSGRARREAGLEVRAGLPVDRNGDGSC